MAFAREISWNGLSEFGGSNIWHKDDTYYLSNGNTHYTFNFDTYSLNEYKSNVESTDNWYFSGSNIFYIDNDIFYIESDRICRLNKNFTINDVKTAFDECKQYSVYYG